MSSYLNNDWSGDPWTEYVAGSASQMAFFDFKTVTDSDGRIRHIAVVLNDDGSPAMEAKKIEKPDFSVPGIWHHERNLHALDYDEFKEKSGKSSLWKRLVDWVF